MRRIIVFTIVTFFTLVSKTYAEDLVFGVTAHRGGEQALSAWTDLKNYLSKQLNETILLRPIHVKSFISTIQDVEFDILLLQPVQTLVAQEKYGYLRLTTIRKSSGTHFAGVIFAHKDSGIKTGKDLMGKRVASMKHGVAAGAYLFQVYHLMQQGIDPHKDFAEFREVTKQQNIVNAVKMKLIDAGFIRSGLLESLDKAGKVSLEDFAIVDQKTDPRLNQLHSTVLYPEWSVSVSAKMDKDLVEVAKKALLKIQPEDKAAVAGSFLGFKEPVSHAQLKKVMVDLKIPPFDN